MNDIVFKDSDHNLEKQTVHGLIRWPNRYPQLSEQLTPDLFDSSNCRKIVGCIHRILQSAPSLQITGNIVAEEIKQKYPDQSLILIDVLKSCGKNHRIDNEAELFYGIERLKKLRTARTLTEACYKISKGLADNFDVESALHTLNEYHTKANVQNAEVTRKEHRKSIKDLLLDVKNRRDNPEQFRGIKGIVDWDEIQAGELNCIALLRKSGKSSALSQMACENALAGHNVIYVTIESPERLMQLRFMSHITKTPFDKLRKNLLSNSELRSIYKYYRERKLSMGDIHIIDVPDRPTSNYIAAIIKEINIKSNIAVCYVDYMNIMRTNEGSVGMYDWKVQAQISAELKAVARKTKAPIWTGLQLNDTGDLSFAKNVGDNADLITTTEKPKGNENSKFVKYLVKYARSIDPNMFTWICQDFSTMSFDTGERPNQEDLKLLNTYFQEEK
tara:strand:- start:8134 stop:9468 length:1335 start_codon:yes stop_codon:yes gene_type:complete